MADYKNGKLLYHLTHIDNLKSIFKRGLKSRAKLKKFTDVANCEILGKREKLSLQDYIPFHFFGGSPFDGSVQLANTGAQFVLITVLREHAKDNNWQVIPRHPLADEDIELMGYEEGFASINWAKMNERDYHDSESKSVCMAECLSPTTVAPSLFQSIFVKDADVKGKVEKLLKKVELTPYVNIRPEMFVK